MAGAGYKLFVTGDVLTAAQVNTYLQQQTVMVFANSTARSTALSGVVSQGMVTFLTGTNSLEYYDGSAWQTVSNPGDITAVTTGATSGLTGGATSGAVDLKFNTTAKGGLLIGTGTGTVSELAVGTNNYVLTADSTQTTGMKWAASSSGGGFTLINTGGTALTGSTVTISSIPNTYKDLEIHIEDYYPGTNGAYMNCYLNGATTGYGGFYQRGRTGEAFNSGNATTPGFPDYGVNNASNKGFTVIRVFDYANTVSYKLFTMNNSNKTATSNDQQWSQSQYTLQSTSAISSIDFTISTGTYSGGTVYVYGVK